MAVTRNPHKRGLGTTSVPPRAAVDIASEEPVHVCIDKEVEDELKTLSMDLAITENADNIPIVPFGATLSPAQMALVAGKKWQIGRTINCAFMGGEQVVKEKIIRWAKEWEKYANLKFNFIEDPNRAEIRIAFDNTDGSWSYIGTDSLSIARHKPTMNYGWLTLTTSEDEYSRVVIHEFGHAIGCIHEHQHPDAGIPWDKEKVYAYYMGPPNKWSKASVDNNLFKRYDKSITQFSEYDKHSIMSYSVPAQLTTTGFSIGWNRTLSEIDKAFVKQMYPFAKQEEEVAFIQRLFKVITGESGTEDEVKSVSGKNRLDAIKTIQYSDKGIRRLFADYLGGDRFDKIKEQLNRNITEEQVVAGILNESAETNNNSFVQNAYISLIARAPNEEELHHAVTNIGISDRYQVLLNIMTDRPYRFRQINSFYKIYLGRTPSIGETNAWINSDADLARIRFSILGSQEFFNKS